MRSLIKRIWIRSKSWEYWPLYITQVPVVIIYLWFAIRARSFLFFYNVNPSIPTGGLFGESKYDIYTLFDSEFYPSTLQVDSNEPGAIDKIESWLQESQLSYPIVAKPDIGERGYKVAIIKNAVQLNTYIESASQSTLIQEYIDYPIELSILAYYYPDNSKEEISSICYKDPLFVKGDGKKTLHQLIKEKDRAYLQLDRLINTWDDNINSIPKAGEIKILELRGNHSKGSTFLNYNHIINDDLTKYFNNQLKKIHGVYYGRFDIKCKSWEDLDRGINIKLIEFNGVGGEPAHVYDPSLSFINMIKVMYYHWRVIYTISRQQSKNGFVVPPLAQGIKDLLVYRNNV